MEMKVLKNIANKIDPKGYYSEENIYPSILKEIKKGVAIELEYINDPKLATRIVVHRFMELLLFSRKSKTFFPTLHYLSISVTLSI